MSQTRSSPGKSDTAEVSAWAPFGNSAFTLLWTATLISNVGTWMHDVGAGWLMTTLSPSPAIVSLVQAATTLPIFLFALFAGALADRVNKKKMLILINSLLGLIVVLLTFLVHIERMTPTLLLVFTLLIGTGTAFMAPAWQAVVPSLVPAPQLRSAIALGSLGVNISRAIGPALAGVLIATVGLAAPFAVNAASFLVIIVALLLWRPPPAPVSELPPEPVVSSMVTGLRHAAFNVPLRDTMLRATGFFLFASAYWALLPLVARAVPDGGAGLYGNLLAAIGAGAVGGAVLLPRVRQHIETNRLVMIGSIATASVMMLFAFAVDQLLLLAASLLAGVSWITVLTSLNVSAQIALPGWVRARGLAVYLMVFFGSMALGATLWGQLAAATSVPLALMTAAALILLAIPVTRSARLGGAEEMDLTPSAYWPEPVLHGELDGSDDRGPAMVSIDYQVQQRHEAEFLAGIHELARERYRDGAYQWGVTQDTENPRHWREWFLVSSWQEHLRQHQRVTGHDRDIQEALLPFLEPGSRPVVSHFLAPETRNSGQGPARRLRQ